MKIFITTPDFSLHGGIRIILEWANRLAELHTVYLYSLKGGQCTWFDISPKVHIVADESVLKHTDCLIITSPHSIHLADRPYPVRKFVFMQMCEHLFRPKDQQWQSLCKKFYTTPHHLISISKWNIDMIKTDFGRTGVTHYVGNGVNLDHFPISHKPKDGKTILVEGWEPGNPSKDAEHIAPRVAARLRAEGYHILAYSGLPLKTMPFVPHEYYHRPSLQQLNELYERATIMIKATRYDARSCAPVEAMTKGTVTARAIDKGDDDLTDGINCRKVPYLEQMLFAAANNLLLNNKRREDLGEKCKQYVQQYSWDHWIPVINNILCNA